MGLDSDSDVAMTLTNQQDTTPAPNEGIQKTMDDYIKTYKFSGFKELCEEYAKNPDPLLSQKLSDSSG